MHASSTSQGYLDDKRNTDHAWLETRIRHYHDDSSTLLKWIEFTSKPSDAMAYEWVGISQAIPIVPHQLQYILKVCLSSDRTFCSLAKIVKDVVGYYGIEAAPKSESQVPDVSVRIAIFFCVH